MDVTTTRVVHLSLNEEEVERLYRLLEERLSAVRVDPDIMKPADRQFAAELLE